MGALLLPRDPDEALKFDGETSDFVRDALRLLCERGQESGGHLGLPSHEFRRCDDQREVIVHVVPHLRELLIELGDLLGGERYWGWRKAHVSILWRSFGIASWFVALEGGQSREWSSGISSPTAT